MVGGLPLTADGSLPVQGAWIEIIVWRFASLSLRPSLPVQGAWIEIRGVSASHPSLWSLPVQGAWIEMAPVGVRWLRALRSLPVQGAWIEIVPRDTGFPGTARRSPCRERGLKSAGRRNLRGTLRVAPRAGSVD